MNPRNFGLLIGGIFLNGLITLPVEAQIKRVTFLPTVITAPSTNTGTLSGGFTWDPSLSGASANSVGVNDSGLTYNISFTGTGGGIGDLAGFTLTAANIIDASSFGRWNLSMDGIFNPNDITDPVGNPLRLITQINVAPDFYAGFDLNNTNPPFIGNLTVYNSTNLTNPEIPGAGSATFSTGNTGLLIEVGNSVPFEFSENLAVLTFLLVLGLGKLYQNRNSFFKSNQTKFTQEESKNELLETTNQEELT